MPGMDTPLIPITFVWTDWRVGVTTEAELEASRQRGNEVDPLVEGEVELTRLWYEVPRRGEHVTLTRVTLPLGTSEMFTGIVEQVFWTDDGVRIAFHG